MVEVDDVAEMVAFLASDAARGYHGASISVDNGITAG
jgi:meso-butanediol dehydrogenase / (S,S)-butanediol dehydrogenase / diacetyl reductase